jgi:hypothetical protein
MKSQSPKLLDLGQWERFVGETKEATASAGERFHEWLISATVNMIKGLDDTFRHFPEWQLNN